MDHSVSTKAILLLSIVWICVFKSQLAYRRGQMAALGGLKLITTDHYLNKVLLKLVKEGMIWRLPFVNVIQTSAIDILPRGLRATEQNCECC